jgi:hypothetical protein
MAPIIGFDRPLRPRWIHETLKVWKPNTPLRDLHEPFNGIVYELKGREGKRKARTVLFRYFLDFEGRSTRQRTIDTSPLATLSKAVSLEDLKPAYLTVLLIKSETLRKILSNMLRLYPIAQRSSIITKQLIEKSVGLHGERDVVKRATRAFLITLSYFGVVERSKTNYRWRGKLACSPAQLAYSIALYSIETGRVEVDLEQLEDDIIFSLLNLDSLRDCSVKYNGKLWSYVRRMSTSKLSLYPDLRRRVFSHALLNDNISTQIVH